MQQETLSPFDSFPRPVADDLVNTGQLVEDHALADIGIAGKGNSVIRILYTALFTFWAGIAFPAPTHASAVPGDSIKIFSAIA